MAKRIPAILLALYMLFSAAFCFAAGPDDEDGDEDFESTQNSGFEEEAILLKQDVLSALRHIHEKEADIIYVDPPYEAQTVHDILHALAEEKYVTENTLIIVESSLDTDFSYLPQIGLQLVREKDYKANRHLFIRKVQKP